ncbi:DUF1553 domain-containing protein [Pedobacter psychroterrae]|uniref:DUF1553 domain-containing protein n=1 Tax=Pedobacter psychroterrae TaxID=2530453 RepID=A0A4R0NNT9_9SPHI|nr:DUF1553 domain-containing protein [Pedobacter psychroterrae]TCD00844.1 DUF1553 domain-containing protein [Pedobacter psychroterrae]
MKFFRNKKLIVLLVLLGVVVLCSLLMSYDKKVDFNTEVKPIINKKCISCHGGVKKQGGFSLLFHEEAIASTKSGKPAIIPGDPDGSELIKRLQSKDPEERMPYKHEALNADEIDIFKRWIKQGAKWGDHWAYLPVKEVEIPDTESDWAKTDIDKFILEKLGEQDLNPSVEADRPTLLRRASLDLIGMAPSKKIAEQYLNAKDGDQAYGILIDSLLASRRFGEKWASMWLDVARYADTKGYEADFGRNIWQYRDWVIRAFNDDKPYNEFITEQIAGDFFVNPTDEQYIATAFQRNTMTNDEGGTNNEEFRVAAVLDRVNTTWEGLLSTTFACVQCHSHPYDPFKHDEFYKFMAYFNNTRDEDISSEYPLLRQYDDSLQLKLTSLIAWVKTNASEEKAKEIHKFLKTGQPVINSIVADSMVNAIIGNNNIALFFKNNAIARIPQVNLSNVDQLIYRYSSGKPGGSMQLRLDKPDGQVIASWKVPEGPQYRNLPVDFKPQKGVHDVYLSYTNATVTNKDEIIVYFDWFRFSQQFPGKGKLGYEENKTLFWTLLEANVQSIPIMVENPSDRQRKTFVFKRGAWTSHGAEVQVGVPKTLAYAMPANAPKNRMGLAMWLTDKRNPLLARTMANRLWEQLFGTGIVETLEDMGTQGMNPTHKELLDHLSWQLMNDYKWSMKRLIREMVMSATYKQDSKVTEEAKEKDLFNKFYARGPRIRLSAEQVRDQHLSVSGILSTKMYGPGVMPWQPAGIWNSPYNGATWNSSAGEDQFRRAIYTYWKRTAPYPSMIAFDGAQRVVCSPRRIRTNTPLQALVTLNDSVYIDIAKYFALRMKKEGGTGVKEQIAKGYEWMMYKPISGAKLKILDNLYRTALNDYKIHPDKAKQILGGQLTDKYPETAALVIVANAMLNLDEAVTKN